jgi:exodeoxyribonuclease VII small subunit
MTGTVCVMCRVMGSGTKIPSMNAPSPVGPWGPKNAATEPVAISYEAALRELESLTAQIETGQLPLDQLLGQYQRANDLLAFCKKQLTAVEQQIKVLDGETLKPWDGA